MVQRMWKQEQDHWGSSARGWILEQIPILEDLNHFICPRDWMSHHSSVLLSFALD